MFEQNGLLGRSGTLSSLDFNLRDQSAQVNIFISAMGTEADDVLFAPRNSMTVKSQTVKIKFEMFFIPRRNVIYERAKFIMRKQKSHELAEMYLTDLHKLAGA